MTTAKSGTVLVVFGTRPEAIKMLVMRDVTERAEAIATVPAS